MRTVDDFIFIIRRNFEKEEIRFKKIVLNKVHTNNLKNLIGALVYITNLIY